LDSTIVSARCRSSLVDRGRHGVSQGAQVERLREHRKEPLATDDVIGGDQDNWDGDAGPTQCGENVRSREARHNHVDYDGVRLERRHGIEYSTTVLHRGHKVALAGEEVAQHLTDIGLVVMREVPLTDQREALA
jgi:hypothetical protein